ncbi:Wall-associated receptor kinase, galacturonan-binding domain [Sesbania bispinosa]|nr:Wall-associated receptor kinase, galacturonan-binding domain [Sesbania bispinosa]
MTTQQLALLVLVLMIAILVRVGGAAGNALPGCIDTCGSVSIPYPFGVGKSSKTGHNCFLEKWSSLTCSNNTLYNGNVRVLNIGLLEGQLEMKFYVSQLCNDTEDGEFNPPSLSTASFTISSKENQFISVGRNTYGYLNSFGDGEEYSTGCLTRFSKLPHTVKDGECSGIGCCEVDIPSQMKNITIQTYKFMNFSGCSYSFVAKRGSYNFSVSHLDKLPFDEFPMVVDWTVGKENERCEFFKDGQKSACMSNSYCDDADTSYGYRCRCKTGYDGNPYHPNGCKGVCAGLIALLGASWLYLIYQKRKLIKQKEIFFQQNGGFILQRRLSEREDSHQIAQIFTAEELKNATNNYNESLIIGKGGFGTVFKGFLTNNRIVAVKKSKVVDQNQAEQFINEVIILSQINHRNVVKLLGCCLDTEVPLLVYEFVNNSTLYDHLHNESKIGNLTWKTRLRIAIETAGALSYLHSDASITIIHRDVKSSNILLDDNYTAKVSDFGASKLVPLDQVELATMVQGTFGYLDPEYMQTSRLTEKSDVYSFGVVLVELLTGQKAVSFQRPEEERSLALHFLSYLENGRLFEILDFGLLNEENREEIQEVAVLASKCMGLKGDERPSMKQVEIELKGIRKIEKHPWTNIDLNLEESQHLLPEVSGIYRHGDSTNYGNTEYDSLRDHVQVAFEIAR